MVAEIYRKAWWPPYSKEVAAAAVYNTEAAAVNAREQSHGQATGRSSMAAWKSAGVSWSSVRIFESSPRAWPVMVSRAPWARGPQRGGVGGLCGITYIQEVALPPHQGEGESSPGMVWDSHAPLVELRDVVWSLGP